MCDALNLKCGPDGPQTDLIVLKIIELTKAGEVDPGRVCGRVLLELGARPESGREVNGGLQLFNPTDEARQHAGEPVELRASEL